MKKFKIILFTVAFILILTTPVFANPSISSECAVLMDMKTGQIIYAKNAHKINHMDNMTKLLNVSTAINNGDISDSLIVTENSLLETTRDSLAGRIGLKSGNTIMLEDALYAEILANANDAARVVASNLGNSDKRIGDSEDVKAYLKMMKKEASYLKAPSINISNVMGVTSSDQISTTTDLANIMRLGFKDTTFKKILTTKNHDITVKNQNAVGADKSIELESLHGIMNGKYTYKDVKGGFAVATESSYFNSVTYAERTIKTDEENPIQRELVVAIMKSTTEDGMYEDIATLLDYGYNQWTEFTIKSSKLHKYLPSDISNNKIVFPQDLQCLLPKGMGKGDLIAETALSENEYNHGTVNFTIKGHSEPVYQGAFYEEHRTNIMNGYLQTILSIVCALVVLVAIFLLLTRVVLPLTRKLKQSKKVQGNKRNRSRTKRRKSQYSSGKVKELDKAEREYFNTEQNTQKRTNRKNTKNKH